MATNPEISATEDTSGKPQRRMWLPSPGWTAVVVLAAIVPGCFFAIWRPYHCEQRVIERLNGPLGMSIGATHEYVGPELLRPYSNHDWMRCLQRVSELRVQDQAWPAGVTQLPSLHSLRRCEEVRFWHSAVDDRRFLSWAATCPRLKKVSFEYSKVSGDALRGLDGREGVREIRMEDCSGLASVLELPEISTLEAVRINGGPFTGVDVRGAPNLVRLEAKSCLVTDEGVALLSGAPRLEVVLLGSHDGDLTDAAIEHLAQVPRLRYLEVQFHHQITRAGLERLAGLPMLRGVNVYGTAAETELAELQRVLPQARAHYGP